MVPIHGSIVISHGGGARVINMDRDTLISNTVTMGAVGMTVMNTIEILTILSLVTAVGLNLILIYKNLRAKKD